MFQIYIVRIEFALISYRCEIYRLPHTNKIFFCFKDDFVCVNSLNSTDNFNRHSLIINFDNVTKIQKKLYSLKANSIDFD